MERDAGSSCMMHPWGRGDCGHELYSPRLLQHIPNPRAGRLDSRTEALCMAQGAAHVASAGLCSWICVCREKGQAGKACLLLQYRVGVPSPVTEGPLVLLFFSSHSINNSNARS